MLSFSRTSRRLIAASFSFSRALANPPKSTGIMADGVEETAAKLADLSTDTSPAETISKKYLQRSAASFPSFHPVMLVDDCCCSIVVR